MNGHAEVGRAGRLTVITGPMFAGKTTALIDRLRAAKAEGRRVVALKSSIDNRYDAEHIVTHEGISIEGRAIASPRELSEIDADPSGAVDLVGVDEVHFFTDFVPEVLALLDRGIDVVCAGLDRSSFHVPISEMGALLCEADEVIKLTASCSICGEPATHTKRLVEDKTDILVGGEGMFEPRCRTHRDSCTPNPPDGGKHDTA